MESGEILQHICSSVPKLSADNCKGEHGKICVIGGCKHFSGAPYFAAVAALRTGADLSHVFCTKDAVHSIKSYCPDVIVHGILDLPNVNDVTKEFSRWVERTSVVVVGPGLGFEGP